MNQSTAHIITQRDTDREAVGLLVEAEACRAAEGRLLDVAQGLTSLMDRQPPQARERLAETAWRKRGSAEVARKRASLCQRVAMAAFA